METEMKENERGLLKKLEEFRRRPSKVSAELYYYTLTTPSWQKIQYVLFEWFDIYSEIESSDLTSYDELKHLVTSIRQEDDQRTIDICRVFYMLRVHNQELWDTDRRRVVRMLASHPSPKSLVCQMFTSIMDGDVRGMLKSARQAFDTATVNTTLSILSSLPRCDISNLRNKMREGHENGENLCDCKNLKTSFESFSCVPFSHNGTDVAAHKKCGIVDIIRELEELIQLLRGSKIDKTNLYKFHLKASRTNFSRHFFIKFKDKINVDEIKSTTIETSHTESSGIKNSKSQPLKKQTPSRRNNSGMVAYETIKT